MKTIYFLIALFISNMGYSQIVTSDTSCWFIVNQSDLEMSNQNSFTKYLNINS